MKRTLRDKKIIRYENIIDNVRKIRASNNDLWMFIMQLAIKARPRQAKKIIRQITANDRKISRWLSRL